VRVSCFYRHASYSAANSLMTGKLLEGTITSDEENCRPVVFCSRSRCVAN